MIDTIIFDIGGVLGRFNWKRAMAEMGFSPEVRKAITDNVMRSGAWNEVDRNIKSDDVLREELCDRAAGSLLHSGSLDEAQIRESFGRLFDRRCDFIYEYEFAHDWLKEWHEQGYRILILSNYSRKMFEEVTSHFSFFEYVDGEVISYREGVIKPEREIYEILITRYGLEPANCVFIDDLPKNLEAAAKLGFHTVLADADHKETAKRLEMELVDIDKILSQRRHDTDVLTHLETEEKRIRHMQLTAKKMVPVMLVVGILSGLAAALLIWLMVHFSITRDDNTRVQVGALAAMSLALPIFGSFALFFISVKYLLGKGRWMWKIDLSDFYNYVKPDLVLTLKEEAQKIYRGGNWQPCQKANLFMDAYMGILRGEIARFRQQEADWRHREEDTWRIEAVQTEPSIETIQGKDWSAVSENAGHDAFFREQEQQLPPGRNQKKENAPSDYACWQVSGQETPSHSYREFVSLTEPNSEGTDEAQERKDLLNMPEELEDSLRMKESTSFDGIAEAAKQTSDDEDSDDRQMPDLAMKVGSMPVEDYGDIFSNRYDRDEESTERAEGFRRRMRELEIKRHKMETCLAEQRDRRDLVKSMEQHGEMTLRTFRFLAVIYIALFLIVFLTFAFLRISLANNAAALLLVNGIERCLWIFRIMIYAVFLAFLGINSKNMLRTVYVKNDTAFGKCEKCYTDCLSEETRAVYARSQNEKGRRALVKNREFAAFEEEYEAYLEKEIALADNEYFALREELHKIDIN